MLDPRAARIIAWLAVLVFGLVVPAHLSGSDHHHHRHAHAHDVAVAGAAIDSACDPHAHQPDEHHHRGHDHQLLIPDQHKPNGSKAFVLALAFVVEPDPVQPSRGGSGASAEPDPRRLDRAPALPRGPPAPTPSVV